MNLLPQKHRSLRRKKILIIIKLLILPIFMLIPFYLIYNLSYNTRAKYTYYYDDSSKFRKTDVVPSKDKIIQEQGSKLSNDNGLGVILAGEDKKKADELMKNETTGINVYLSDILPANRTIKDYRLKMCSKITYDDDLPLASIIITFRNDPFSVIIRTLWSVINSVHKSREWYKNIKGYSSKNSTEYVHLKEILLIDDKCKSKEMFKKLEKYIQGRFPKNLIKLFKRPESSYTIGSVIHWAGRMAAGEVIVFLHGHIEVNSDWLRPLLQRIKQSRTTFVVSIEDEIDRNTFKYDTGLKKGSAAVTIGSFTFYALYRRVYVDPRKVKDVTPQLSPTMSGNMFAVDRSFFFDLFEGEVIEWGGENVEMSFKIWMCGGQIETIPCSRIGHIGHKNQIGIQSETFWMNAAQLAEQWMGEFKEIFYMFKPESRLLAREKLHQDNKCNDFKWYLQTAHRGKFIPIRDGVAYGRIQNKASNLCLDTMDNEDQVMSLYVNGCRPGLHPSQFFAISQRGEVRDEHRCAEVIFPKKTERKVTDEGMVFMSQCLSFKPLQVWRLLQTNQLQHVESGLCMDSGWKTGTILYARPCFYDIPTMKWEIDYNKQNDYLTNGKVLDIEHEYTLRLLKHRLRENISYYTNHSEELEVEMKHLYDLVD